MKSIAFYFDVVCPFAYLAFLEIEGIAREAGAELELCPILLGGVFRAVGSPQSPSDQYSAGKRAHSTRDLERFAARAGRVLRRRDDHPRSSVLAIRSVLGSGNVAASARAIFEAYWREARDFSDPETLERVLTEAGLDGRAAVLSAETSEVKERLRQNTERAVGAGAFGVPWIVVTTERGQEAFWGVDQLGAVREELGLSVPPIVWPTAALASPRDAATDRADEPSRPNPKALRWTFDYSSPYAYFASVQIERLVRDTGADLELRPILLGGLFRAIGTPDVPLLAMNEKKQAYNQRVLERAARRLGVPFQFPNTFPIRTVSALRLTLLAPIEHRLALSLRLFRAAWGENEDLTDEGVLRRLSKGWVTDEAFATLGDERWKTALRASTDTARDEGIFGVPTFQVRPHGGPMELLFGEDRLPWVRAALAS